MKAAIRQRAGELGFDDCRVTTADPPASGPQFEQWLAQRCHGEMDYLERTAPKRLSPRHVLPGAKTILALAVSYSGDGSPDPEARSREARSRLPGSESITVEGSRMTQAGARSTRGAGLVARYARYTDYHHVIGEQLKQLTQFINQLGGPNTRSLWYVDTGPLLERDLAERAGLGFIGKHTNLISRKFGNWIFLSEILTTLELEQDESEKNRCGSCTRCLAACPTGAITGPFRLDARLCISYLTIESKGPIPVDLRPAIGVRIFGCDDCLAVCPWNRFAREGWLMKRHSLPGLATPDLLELLALDEPAFKRRFTGTPVLRTKRTGLLRNVCVALGNIGDDAALPALQKAAAAPEPLIAEHAQWAIGQIRQNAGK